jgi:hypothetical protein
VLFSVEVGKEGDLYGGDKPLCGERIGNRLYGRFPNL